MAPVVNRRLVVAQRPVGTGRRPGRNSNRIWSRLLAAALTVALAEASLGFGSVASINTIKAAQKAQSPLADLPARKTALGTLLPEPKGRECAFAAHALLVESTPAPNSSVAGPDIEIRMRFNSRVDEVRSRLTLVFPDHTTYRLEIHKQAADMLTSRATGLKSGAHSLQWQVLASDGHLTRGEVPFAVD
jgi:methionine-rich copper-binding protein CopC